MAMSHRCRCPPHTAPQVVLFAVPGAFTPTCSLKHLPGFIEKVGAWLRARLCSWSGLCSCGGRPAEFVFGACFV